VSTSREGQGGTGSAQAAPPPLFVVNGDASAEEVAALVTVLQGVAGAARAAVPPEEPRSEWSAHHRKVRAAYPVRSGGWRSSAMPR